MTIRSENVERNRKCRSVPGYPGHDEHRPGLPRGRSGRRHAGTRFLRSRRAEARADLGAASGGVIHGRGGPDRPWSGPLPLLPFLPVVPDLFFQRPFRGSRPRVGVRPCEGFVLGLERLLVDDGTVSVDYPKVLHTPDRSRRAHPPGRIRPNTAPGRPGEEQYAGSRRCRR